MSKRLKFSFSIQSIKDFPYVRVDFYDVDGKIYFGEMTFFPGSGYYDFEPDEFDFILGEKFYLKGI